MNKPETGSEISDVCAHKSTVAHFGVQELIPYRYTHLVALLVLLVGGSHKASQ